MRPSCERRALVVLSLANALRFRRQKAAAPRVIVVLYDNEPARHIVIVAFVAAPGRRSPPLLLPRPAAVLRRRELSAGVGRAPGVLAVLIRGLRRAGRGRVGHDARLPCAHCGLCADAASARVLQRAAPSMGGALATNLGSEPLRASTGKELERTASVRAAGSDRRIHAHARGTHPRAEVPCARASMDGGSTVFATVFLPGGKHLLAACGTGKAYIWEVDPLLDAAYWESSQPGHKPAPLVVHQLHDCAIFSVCLLSDSVLLTGGDDCIKAWQIDSLLPGRGKAPQPMHKLVPPQIEVGRGGRLPVAETNGLAVNASRSAFYSACGDGRAYCWDSTTFKLRAKLEGHTNYLHCVACQGDNAVATGSEDGTVRIWDARDPSEPEELVSSGAAPNGARPSWIGAVDIDESGQWVVAGGGGRSVGMWHLPSRKLVANMPTCGAVHALQFCGDKLVSGGAEPAVYLWSRSGVFMCGFPPVATRASTRAPAHVRNNAVPAVCLTLCVAWPGKLCARVAAPQDTIYSLATRSLSQGAASCACVHACLRSCACVCVCVRHIRVSVCMYDKHAQSRGQEPGGGPENPSR